MRVSKGPAEGAALSGLLWRVAAYSARGVKDRSPPGPAHLALARPISAPPLHKSRIVSRMRLSLSSAKRLRKWAMFMRATNLSMKPSDTEPLHSDSATASKLLVIA